MMIAAGSCMAAQVAQPVDSQVLPGEQGVDSQALVEEQEVDLRTLVEELADDSFRVREAAQLALWGLGDAGVEALELGVKSDDPERAYRSRVVLRRILTGIGPETPAAIVQLVERYFRGTIEVKLAVMESLRDALAYSQMLRLYRFEQDLVAREECAEVVEEVVVPAVAAELVGGDLLAAEALLRLAPVTDANLRRRAALLREMGKLDLELALVPEGTDDPWRLAMLRAQGDLAGSIALADKLGREDLRAAFAILQGDPVPFFNWYAAQGKILPIHRINAELARNRWQGDERGAARIAKVLTGLVEDGAEEDRIATLSLVINGYLDEAIRIWESDPVYRAQLFSYYESVERPAKAVAVYGYKGSKDDKRQWRSEQLEGLRDDWADANDPLDRLLTVAAFLVARGEIEEGFEMVLELGALVKKQGGQEEWEEFLEYLTQQREASFGELALAVAIDELGPEADDLAVASVLGILFQDSSVANRYWKRLSGEDLNVSERLLQLGGLFGMIDVAPDKLDPLMVILQAEADEAQGEALREILTDFLRAATYRDETKEIERLLRELVKIDGLDHWSDSLGRFSGYMGDWEGALACWEALLTQKPHSYRALTKVASVHLRLGDAAKAEVLFDRADLLSLDEPEVLQVLANSVYTLGARGRAEDYLRTLLLTGAPTDRYWGAALGIYAKRAKEGGRWREAAAASEIDALFEIRDRPTYINPVVYLRKRFDADLMRGMALWEEGSAEEAQKVFAHCFRLLEGDGLLADDFFPLLRTTGLQDDYERYFERAYRRIQSSLEAYPRAHNSYNGAAWLASRACRRLDDALEMAGKALELRPRQAAYLDTMAEVWFAKHDRAKAVQWSRRACYDSRHAAHENFGGAEMREQLRRFEEDEFPRP